MKTFLGLRVIKLHLLAWLLALIFFALMSAELRGFEWTAIAFGLSALAVVLTGFFAIPVAVVEVVEAFRCRRYWRALIIAALATVSLSVVMMWIVAQRMRP